MKNTMRLLSVFLAAVMMLAVFVGCGDDSTETVTSESDTKSKEMKIEDIAWTVDEGLVDGERYVMLSYTNNSKFIISNFEISFKEKSDVTEEQKAKYFDEVKKIYKLDENNANDMENFENLKSKGIVISAKSEQVCRPGESIQNKKCCYYSSGRYLKNIEHFNLSEPDVAIIKYVEDNKICTLNYDFKSKKYTKDTKIEAAFAWSEKEIGNAVPKPKADIVTVSMETDDYYHADIHGWTLDDFNAYIKECQEKGFTLEKYEHEGYYSAESQSGYSIIVDYDEDDCNVSLMVDKKSAS